MSASGARHSRLDLVLPVALLALLTAAFFGPVFMGRTSSTIPYVEAAVWPWTGVMRPPTSFYYPQSDQADSFYPYQAMSSREVRQGRLPLWNPYTLGGVPLQPNGLSGVLYPPRLLLAGLANPALAHDLFLVGHVFLAGVAMVAFSRRQGLHPAACALSGVAWAFSSFTLGWMQLEPFLVIAAMLPAALLCVDHAVIERSWRWTAATSICLAAVLVGTSFVLAPVVGSVVGLYGLGVAVTCHPRGWHSLLARLWILAVATVLGLALSAVTVLPTVVLARTGQRAAVSLDEVRVQHTVAWSAFAGSFWPPASPPNEALLHRLTFVGTLVAALALGGVFRRGRGAWLGRMLAVAMLLATTQTPLLTVAYRLIPGFAYIHPLGRLLFLWSFAVALLGAFGIDGILRLLSMAGGSGRTRLARPAAVVLVLAAIGASAGQLLALGRALNPPFTPRLASRLYPITPAVKALLAEERRLGGPGMQRVLPLRKTSSGWTPPVLPASQTMVLAIESAGGYESLMPSRTADLWRVVSGEDPDDVVGQPLRSAFLPSYETGRTRFAMLPRVGLTTILAPTDVERDPVWKRATNSLSLRLLYAGEDGRVYAIEDAMPRVRVVYAAEYLTDRRQILRRITEAPNDLRVVLETRAEEVGTPLLPTRAVIKNWSPGEMTVTLRATRDGWLVVGDQWAAGWEARVDGRPAPLLRADYNLRAIPVAAGPHRVDISYTPPGFRVGVSVSILGACVVLVLLVAPGSLKPGGASRSDPPVSARLARLLRGRMA